MKISAKILAQLNAWFVLLLGLIFGIYESTTRLYTSYPYKYEFDWRLFSKWVFGTYCFSMLFYILSEVLAKSDKVKNEKIDQ